MAPTTCNLVLNMSFKFGYSETWDLSAGDAFTASPLGHKKEGLTLTSHSGFRSIPRRVCRARICWARAGITPVTLLENTKLFLFFVFSVVLRLCVEFTFSLRTHLA